MSEIKLFIEGQEIASAHTEPITLPTTFEVWPKYAKCIDINENKITFEYAMYTIIIDADDDTLCEIKVGDKLRVLEFELECGTKYKTIKP